MSWVRFLGQEDPLEEGMTTHSVYLPGECRGQRSLENAVDRGAWRATVHKMAESTMTDVT